MSILYYVNIKSNEFFVKIINNTLTLNLNYRIKYLLSRLCFFNFHNPSIKIKMEGK